MASKNRPLHNRVNKQELREKMLQSDVARVTISFYKYHRIEDPSEFRNQLFRNWQDIEVYGRVYVATEGINAQISVPQEKLEEFKKELYSILFLEGVRLNIAFEDDGKSFSKLTIKVRPKIVADGLNDESFDPSDTGAYLKAEDFNKLATQEDTIIVDMRNHYESEVGHFEGALLPDADTFKDELPMVEEMLQGKEEQNIIMYCTGGIRCEKATAYFKHKGFKSIFHLEGGIIKYAQDVKAKGLDNKFKGKNFVFDERLGERITEEIVSQCHQCGNPCDTHINCANDACHLLFIQCENCNSTYDACCSQECKTYNSLPEEEQKVLRQGLNKGRQVFKKGRLRPEIGENLIVKSLKLREGDL